jgi:peptidyl-tRNA hydrolase
MYNVQCIVVREDIIQKYGFGFVAAQICHASMAPITNQIQKNPSLPMDQVFDRFTKEWVLGCFVKLVYGVPSLQKLHMVMDRLDSDGIDYAKIIESKINDLTCIGLKPYDKGKVAPYFKDLQLLGGKKEKPEQDQGIMKELEGIKDFGFKNPGMGYSCASKIGQLLERMNSEKDYG